jgi:pyrroloquinoline quinone (PQQ) biosynthesis protein C
MHAWRRGELSPSDLQILATEQDHLVVATAVVARRAADLATGPFRERLTAIAEECDADVEQWRQFSIATGWCHSGQWQYGADPFAETVACARSVAGLRKDTLGQTAARLHTVLTAHKAVAPTQLAALLQHFEIDRPATSWFARRDASARMVRLIEPAINALRHLENPSAVASAARRTYQSLWTFYDGLAANRVAEPPTVRSVRNEVMAA